MKIQPQIATHRAAALTAAKGQPAGGQASSPVGSTAQGRMPCDELQLGNGRGSAQRGLGIGLPAATANEAVGNLPESKKSKTGPTDLKVNQGRRPEGPLPADAVIGYGEPAPGGQLPESKKVKNDASDRKVNPGQRPEGPLPAGTELGYGEPT